MKHGAGISVAVLAGGLIGGGTVLAAGPDFLKIEGIRGGSTAAQHVGEIDVLNFSFGAFPHPAAVAGGARATTVPTRDLTITKKVDASSPSLMAACATGKHIPEVTLETRFMKYELQNVVISSFRSGGATETVVLNYASVQQLPVMASPPNVGRAARAPSNVLIKQP